MQRESSISPRPNTNSRRCVSPAATRGEETSMTQLIDTSALREGILDELRWDAAVDATRIDLHFIDTVAVLKGAVRTYAEKCRAEETVKRTPGISAVRNRIEVRLTIGDYRT